MARINGIWHAVSRRKIFRRINRPCPLSFIFPDAICVARIREKRGKKGGKKKKIEGRRGVVGDNTGVGTGDGRYLEGRRGNDQRNNRTPETMRLLCPDFVAARVTISS